MKSVIMLSVIIVFSIMILPQAEKLKEGAKAPDFTLEDAYGEEYTLSSFKDVSPVVVYFYPKANTSGCTKQACGIRDNWSKFEKNNIKVLGISTDSKEEIKEFIDDYNLNFPLLSDLNKKVTSAYGILSENGNAKRVTFIVDKKGIIKEILEVKDIDSHSDYVFNSAMKLKD
jgi:peroxiredoxin Q/BCP